MLAIIIGLGFGVMFSVLQSINKTLPEKEKIPLWKGLVFSAAWPITILGFFISKKNCNEAFQGVLQFFKKSI